LCIYIAKFIYNIIFLSRINNVIDNESFEDNPGSSNSLASVENVQTLRTDELQIHKNGKRQNTTSSYINKCQAVLDKYISERSKERQHKMKTYSDAGSRRI